MSANERDGEPHAKDEARDVTTLGELGAAVLREALCRYAGELNARAAHSRCVLEPAAPIDAELES